jgi:uncharacterized damage-inducible protein DinB
MLAREPRLSANLNLRSKASSLLVNAPNFKSNGSVRRVRRSPKLNLMTCDDLRLLIDYNYWARDRVLDAVATITPEQFIRPMGNSFTSVRDTVAHICAAERIWITRLKGENPQGLQKPDRLRDVDAARKEWAELEGEMRDQLARLGPEAVELTIEYQDLRGNDQSDVLWQMLQHLVNHGTYHRGQITTMLRQLDAAPPKSMDLTAFYRERNRKA